MPGTTSLGGDKEASWLDPQISSTGSFQCRGSLWMSQVLILSLRIQPSHSFRVLLFSLWMRLYDRICWADKQNCNSWTLFKMPFWHHHLKCLCLSTSFPSHTIYMVTSHLFKRNMWFITDIFKNITALFHKSCPQTLCGLLIVLWKDIQAYYRNVWCLNCLQKYYSALVKFKSTLNVGRNFLTRKKVCKSVVIAWNDSLHRLEGHNGKWVREGSAMKVSYLTLCKLPFFALNHINGNGLLTSMLKSNNLWFVLYTVTTQQSYKGVALIFFWSVLLLNVFETNECQL